MSHKVQNVFTVSIRCDAARFLFLFLVNSPSFSARVTKQMTSGDSFPERGTHLATMVCASDECHLPNQESRWVTHSSERWVGVAGRRQKSLKDSLTKSYFCVCAYVSPSSRVYERLGDSRWRQRLCNHVLVMRGLMLRSCSIFLMVAIVATWTQMFSIRNVQWVRREHVFCLGRRRVADLCCPLLVTLLSASIFTPDFGQSIKNWRLECREVVATSTSNSNSKLKRLMTCIWSLRMMHKRWREVCAIAVLDRYTFRLILTFIYSSTQNWAFKNDFGVLVRIT